MSEGASFFSTKGEDDMWTPFKELQGTVEDCISDPGQKNSLKRLETALRKHKQNFITILKNPPKSAKCREELKHDSGSSVGGAPLAHDLVEEACILSDMYDLNEYLALQLLTTAERQMPCHPGLPRGLVGVLLYYDGRAALAGALCTLVRARRGVTWDLYADVASSMDVGVEEALDGQKAQLTDYVTCYTEELAESGLLEHLIDLVEELDITREIERLHGGRALGGPRHRREVTHLFLSLRQTIADTIFFWSAQTGLAQRPLARLIEYMKKVKEEANDGILSNVNLSLTMAMLYAIDLGILHRKDDRDVLAKKLPLLSDKGVGQELLCSVCPSYEEQGIPLEESWVCPALLGLFQLSLGLCVSTLRSAGTTDDLMLSDAIMDDEDNLVDSAVRLCVFELLYRTVLGNTSFYKEEFFLRRIHGLLADFIILHPTKVRELRRAADDAARTIQAHAQEGLEPPSNLQYHFESFLRSVGRLHEQDPLGLQLSLDYWPRSTVSDPRHGTAAHILSSAHLLGSSDGRGALWRFVRQCGWGDSPHPLPPALFVPYLQMLRGLSSSPRAAAQCFAFLRQQSLQPSPVLIPEGRSDASALSGMGPVPSSPISWDHFFRSLHRYLCNLRVELPPIADTVYGQRTAGGAGVPLISRGITPLELEGLHAVLALLTTIAERDESSRLALAENPSWGAIPSLLGLVTCPVPIPLKARLILALAALATPSSTSERQTESSVTTLVWHHLEASQILITVPTTSCYQPRGVQTELEEVESRNEEYPLTRAMLHLLDALTGAVGPSPSKATTVPPLLGMGTRCPGLDPYLHYIINSVFIPFNTRSYRNLEEKWLVCRLCLRLFLKFLRQYEPSSEDFTARIVEVREGNTSVTGSGVVTTTPVAPPPGFHLMIHLHSKSELLRMILNIVDEVAGCLEDGDPRMTENKKERRLMKGCALGCLRVLRRALALQARFTAFLSASSEDPLLLTGLDCLLLAANPRSGKHDHLLNIARYVSHSVWLPKHSPAALGILALATACPRSPSSPAQVHLLSLLTSSPQAAAQVRHAFVECLEAEEDEVIEFEEDKSIGPDEGDEEDEKMIGDTLLEPSEGSSPTSSEPLKGLSVRGRAKAMVLKLLLQWLPQSPAPNLAHFFLGFHLSKDLRKTVFQQPGILGFPRTCLHALLSTLDHGLSGSVLTVAPNTTQTTAAETGAIRPRAPHSALLDLGYRLLYALCADPRTSEPVLRFLRSSSTAGGVAGGHYLTRHLLSIPIIATGDSSRGTPQKKCEVNALGQTSWLLRTVAVELKALASNRHHLQLTTLLRTLLSAPTVPGAQASGSTIRAVGPPWPSRASDAVGLSVEGSRIVGEEEGKDEETTLQLSRSHLLPVGTLPPSGARPHDRLLIRLLEALDFSPEPTPSPNWEFFEPSQIQQVLRHCESPVAPGGDSWPHVAPSCPSLRLVDLVMLRCTLVEELQAIQGSQRQAIVAEMKDVLQYAKQHNHRRARAWGVARCMEGWCQVTEVLFATTPSEALAAPLHLQLLLDVLQVILKKSLSADVSPDLATLSSGVILLLLVNLRHLHLVAVREARLRCLPQMMASGKSQIPGSQMEATPVASHLAGRNPTSLGAEATLQANSAALKVILSGILQWIVSSAPQSQKLRINLYGALLNFLHVTCTESDEWNVGIPSGGSGANNSLTDSFRSSFSSTYLDAGPRGRSQLTEEERSRRLACLELMVGFGEGLVDVLCHDSTSGHDVCKMLALSCLETLVGLDASTGPATTLSLLCSRGFVCHLVDSLLASDRTLQGVLEDDEVYAGGGGYAPGCVDLRPLYVYESKMAALCRIARSSRNGAEALLERKVIGCLSAMRVFDVRPDGPFWSHVDGTSAGDFVPPVAGRYLQVWLPALYLCDALLISLGSRNESCASQVAHFLVSHSEAVGAALRGGGAPRSGSTSSQGHLQELASLTGVVALAARHPGIIGPEEGAVPADPLWRVRKLMFSLLHRFLLPEEVAGAKGTQVDEEAALCSLKVAAHLLLYVRRLSVPDGAVGETGGAADPRECRILFSPSLSGAELVPSGDPRGTRTTTTRNIPVRAGGIGTSGPPLGLLVARLVSAVGLDTTLGNAETQLYGQLASVPDMNSQELREFLPEGASMTAASMEAARAQAARCLGRRLQQTIRRRELLWFVADHCLLLLWVHLDHFLLRSFVPGDRIRPLGLNASSRADDDASWITDVEEISRLKSGLVSVFNDSFCKRLIETRQEANDRGFVEALVRRIKRLIQFVPVS